MQTGLMQTSPLLQTFPFIGLLLSIALIPGIAPRWWGRWMGWVAAGWTLLLIPILGPLHWAHVATEATIDTYLPFVAVMGSLYVISGGILLRGGPGGRPLGNAALLASGALLALVMGTAGAAMVIAQPLLHANAHRKKRFHLVLFLILLVANAAGLLTPLGNPPLLAGMTRGIPFAWPAQNLFQIWLLTTGLLLAIFFATDLILARREPAPPPRAKLSVRGWGNVALVLVPGLSVMPPLASRPLAVVAFSLAAGAISWWTTPPAIRRANDFSWHPMTEVALLFVGIFITLAPVSALLRAGLDGPFAFALRATADAHGDIQPALVYWMAGILSAFLDNAPAYLVFFDLAAIHPAAIDAPLLRAISAGAVLFGGLTYIGNAPNLMLRAVASHRGVRMPGFGVYSLWSCLVMLPVLALVSITFF